MKKALTVLAGGLLIGAFAASYAKLLPPPPEEKAAAVAKAQKDAAAKATSAKELALAQDKAVANYKKHMSSSSGANHAGANPPQQGLTRQEAWTTKEK